MSTSVEVVIVNWNTGDHLRECLASLTESAQEGPVVSRVVVVDNASADDSLEGLDEIPLPLEVVRNSDNLGFAAACNQGAAGSSADYLLFLNPDTRLLPDTLARVTEFMDGDPASRVGICGVQILGRDGRPDISCERFPSLRILFGKMTGLARLLPRIFPRHHLSPAELRRSGFVDQVIGAFYFVRRDLFTRLNGFDERYFIYFEEVDFALRARRAGSASYFLKDARAFHVGNVSSDQIPDVRLYHSLRSRLLFAYEHWPRAQARTLLLLTFAVELPARLIRAATHGRAGEVRSTASAYRMLMSDFVARAAPRRAAP